MELMLPSWVFQALFIGYFVLLAVLTYIIMIRPIGVSQRMLNILVLWLLPIIGPIIVLLSLNKLARNP